MWVEQINDKLLNWASMLDDKAREQAIQTSSIAIIAGHVALMPDAHWGMGCTIGSVIPTKDAIIPSAVGVDIGCGVIAARTRLTASELPDNLSPIISLWEERIPAGLGYWHAEENEDWQEFVRLYPLPERVQRDAKMRGRAPVQFGTLGSGNHFLEVCLDEEDNVWLMLHSGSRGVGNQLATHHINTAKGLLKKHFVHLPDPDLAYFVQGTPEFNEYIRDLNWAQMYAYGSRQQMMNEALVALAQVSGKWNGGGKPQIIRTMPLETINNHHNYARLEVHDGKELWITRKGAIRAREDELGVIPGSMGTGSFVVRGLGNPHSYYSASHGAGRAMSRGQARKQFSAESLTKDMAGLTWQHKDAQALVDEAPGAYKDLAQVMADQEDLVEIVHRLRTIVNYKGVEKGNRKGNH